MASSNGSSRWYHQVFSNQWLRIFIVSKTSKKEISKFLCGVNRIFLNLRMILNSRSYSLNKLIPSLFIDRHFYFDNFGAFYKDTLVYLWIFSFDGFQEKQIQYGCKSGVINVGTFTELLPQIAIINAGKNKLQCSANHIW